MLSQKDLGGFKRNLLVSIEQKKTATGIDIEKIVGGIAAKNEPKVIDEKKE